MKPQIITLKGTLQETTNKRKLNIKRPRFNRFTYYIIVDEFVKKFEESNNIPFDVLPENQKQKIIDTIILSQQFKQRFLKAIQTKENVVLDFPLLQIQNKYYNYLTKYRTNLYRFMLKKWEA